LIWSIPYIILQPASSSLRDHSILFSSSNLALSSSLSDEQIAIAKEGKEAYIGIKINSLTDKVIIEKLVEASMSGVKIDMIIRGSITCHKIC